MKKIIEISVYLPEENVDTWIITTAEFLGNGLYKILPPDRYDPEDIVMEFLPGTIVRVKEKTLCHGTENKPCLVAVEASS